MATTGAHKILVGNNVLSSLEKQALQSHLKLALADALHDGLPDIAQLLTYLGEYEERQHSFLSADNVSYITGVLEKNIDLVERGSEAHRCLVAARDIFPQVLIVQGTSTGDNK